MARIRSVKPEFWADEDLADVSRDARLLYIGLWNLSDEHGRLRGDPRYVKGQLFPYDDDLSAAAVDELLKTLEVARKVVRYRVGAGQYVFLPNLGKHQRLESDKVPSRLPPPPDPNESAQVSAPGPVDPDSRADKSAPRTDESAPGAEDHALLYGTGSMGQVACVAEHDGAAAPRADKPRRTQGATAVDGNPRAANAAAVVAAYIEGARAAGHPKPSGNLPDRVGKDAKRLLADGVAVDTLITAARAMGGKTWHNLDVELQKQSAGRNQSRTGNNGWDGPHLNHDDPHAFDGYRPHHRENTDDVA